MLKLSETRTELRVVIDQHGIPTSCMDLSFVLSELIDDIIRKDEVGGIFHFSNDASDSGVTWADFAREILLLSQRNVQIIDCTSSEYPTKARRPAYSILWNNSDIILPDWQK